MNAMNSQRMQHHNLETILHHMRHNLRISRADLARQTGLSPSSISALITQLINMGLVDAELPVGTHLGRKPISIALRPIVTIGICLSPDELKIAKISLTGEIQDAHSLSVEDPEITMPLLLETISKLLSPGQQILGISMVVPGVLQEGSSLATTTTLPAWLGYPLRQQLQEAFNLPVLLSTNSHGGALAESWFTPTAGQRLMYVLLDHGLGSAMAIGGDLFSSQSGSTEIGHITIDLHGERCACGNFGCLETVVSGNALLRRAEQLLDHGSHTLLLGQKLDLDSILDAIAHGDTRLSMEFSQMAVYFGVGLSTLINLLSPEDIRIGGRIPQRFPHWLAQASQVAMTRAFPALGHNVNITLSTLGSKGPLMGTAPLLFRERLKSHLETNIPLLHTV